MDKKELAKPIWSVKEEEQKVVITKHFEVATSLEPLITTILAQQWAIDKELYKVLTDGTVIKEKV